MTLWPGVSPRALRTIAGDLGAALKGVKGADETTVDTALTDAHHARMLWLAQRDVIVHGLGWNVTHEDVVQLTPEQQGGLARAALMQALWLLGAATTHGSEYLGPPRIASQSSHEGPALSFTRDARPRFSPAAMEQLVLLDLIRRAPMAHTVD